jgi:heptaprenyl diphosphate synthase
MSTIRIAYYLPVLLVAGLLTGLLLGIISKLIVDRVEKIKNKL